MIHKIHEKHGFNLAGQLVRPGSFGDRLPHAGDFAAADDVPAEPPAETADEATEDPAASDAARLGKPAAEPKASKSR